MTKYLLLYHGGGMPETEEETAKVLKQWEAWYNQLGNAVVDPGNPISPVAKKLSSSGVIGDGPAGSPVSGYTILEAGSLDAAAKLAKNCPVLLSGGEISVFETFNVV
jgi:hypothetical protein